MAKCVAGYTSEKLRVTVEMDLKPSATDEVAAMALTLASSIARTAGGIGDLLTAAGARKLSAEEFQIEFLQLGIEMFKTFERASGR